MRKACPYRMSLAFVVALTGAAQTSQQYAVNVNGNPVVTTRPATRIAGEWFVPLAPIATALGAELKIDAASKSIPCCAATE